MLVSTVSSSFRRAASLAFAKEMLARVTFSRNACPAEWGTLNALRLACGIGADKKRHTARSQILGVPHVPHVPQRARGTRPSEGLARAPEPVYASEAYPVGAHASHALGGEGRQRRERKASGHMAKRGAS